MPDAVRTALVIGNGPSAWWIHRAETASLRQALAAERVYACNLAAFDLDCDSVAAIDRDVVIELQRRGALIERELVVGESTWRRMLRGHEVEPSRVPSVQLLPDPDAGYSSGCGAVIGALRRGMTRIVLAGFDGSADPRSRYQGQPLYRSRPTRSCIFRGWEQKLVELARENRGRVEWWVHAQLGPHPLDGIGARRVDLREMVPSLVST